MSRARAVDRGVDEARRDVLAAVRDDVVDLEHLHRGHRDALPDRDAADRRSRPVLRVEHETRRLAREVQGGLVPQPELPEVLVDALLAEHLGDHDRADVR
jgi:hypothetical protein